MRSKGGASGPLLFAVIGLLVLLPMLYVLSAGPAHWLWTRGYISGDEGSFLWMFYTPMRWTYESCEPFLQFIEWYQAFFTAENPTYQ